MLCVLPDARSSAASVTAPDTRRNTVKLAASISPVANAIRQRMELKAKAVRAKAVRTKIFIVRKTKLALIETFRKFSERSQEYFKTRAQSGEYHLPVVIRPNT